MNNLNTAVLVIFPLAFIAYAIFVSGKIKSVNQYFHRSNDNAWLISLVAANITLGTGIAYLFSLAGQLGLWALVSPIAVVASYYLFSQLADRRKNVLVEADGVNFIKWIENVSNQENKTNTKLISLLPSIALLTTFLMLLGFEVYAASKIILPLITDSPKPMSIYWLAAGLCAAVICYGVLSGVRVTLSSDKVQILGVLIVILLIFIPLKDVELSKIDLSTSFKVNKQTIWLLFGAIIGGIGTQFYSLLNWGALSNFQAENNPSRVLKLTGLITAIVLSIFIIAGFIFSKSTGAPAIFDTEIVNYFSSFNSSIFAPLLLIGLLGIIFSTADSVVLQLTYFSYENVFNGKSNTEEKDTLKKIRLLSFVLLVIASSLTLLFIHFAPNLLYLLFAIAGGVVVYAPLLFTAFLMSNDKKKLANINTGISIIYFVIFLAAVAANIYATLYKPELSNKVLVYCFVFSCAISLLLYMRSSRENISP